MGRKRVVDRAGLFDREELFRTMVWVLALAFCLTFWAAIAGAVSRTF
jgi:hypothetical protein